MFAVSALTFLHSQMISKDKSFKTCVYIALVVFGTQGTIKRTDAVQKTNKQTNKTSHVNRNESELFFTEFKHFSDLILWEVLPHKKL